MYKVMNHKKRKKTGKGFLIVLSCLIFLSGTVAFPMTVFGKAVSSVVPDEEEEENGRFRQVGGFDNPIDDRYLALIYAGAQEDDIANINRVLIDYENAWRTQTENYLKEYRFQCKYLEDKEMVDEYLAAVKEAVSAQNDLMEYLEMEEATQHWYAAQIYRCAYVKGIRGTFAEEGSGAVNVDIGQNYVPDISDLVYKECGEFENEIDREYAVHMFDGCEAEIRTKQEEFELAWCDKLSRLTMEFYETLDEEGKYLADAWQTSRERWKETFSNRFWWSPEDLNAASCEDTFRGIGTRAGILEVDGWINRLYYLQLEKMMEKANDIREKNVLRKLIWTSAIGGMTAVEYIVALKDTDSDKLPIAEDGYYEIYTAYDYERFWEMVSNNRNYINGRLMSDIYLNDITDFDNWENTPPTEKSKEVSCFFGDFDGKGHTVYGLYSENGYGIVKKNEGTIRDLSIKSSLIIGNAQVGGICLNNLATINGCEFGGILKSIVGVPAERSGMAGICVWNGGTLERCGYTGTMLANCGWNENGVRAGICAENHMKIFNCYNTSLEDSEKNKGTLFAIADRGEKECFVKEGLNWKVFDDSQIMTLNEMQAAYLSPFLERDLYTVYRTGQNLLIGFLSSARMKGASDEEQEALRIIFSDEILSDYIWEVLMSGEENWNDIWLEAIGISKKDDIIERVLGRENVVSPAVKICSKEENIKLAAYYTDKQIENDHEKILTFCSEILGEKNEETWEHYTWRMFDAWDSEKVEFFVLYEVDEGKTGFFYVTEGAFYQVELQNALEGAYSEGLKEKVNNLFKGEAGEETGTEESVRRQAKIWGSMIQKTWKERQPVDGLEWQDEIISQAVYDEMICYTKGIPSIEEITGLESLQISNADKAETFGDLSMFPRITSLLIRGECGKTAKIDLTGEMVPKLRKLSIENVRLENTEFLEKFPELTALYIMHIDLSDLSFLSKMPKLEDVSFYDNDIRDISPLACCGEIKVLSLAYNKIEDITPLSGLNKLEKLEIQGNKITDISALQKLTGLKGMNLSGNQITDISPLNEMTQMYSLFIDHNQVRDISVLEDMTQMEYLGLGYNRIKDCSPIRGMEKLFSLSVAGNPGQDIGDLIFVPMLSIGRANSDEELKKAQNCLDRYYPERRIEAEEIARGDLDGDGIEDLAIVGLTVREEGGKCLEDRAVYPFLGQSDGSLVPLDMIETLGPRCEGIVITDQRLVLKIYVDNDWRWGNTEIYEYEDGRLAEKWMLDMDHLGWDSGYNWTVNDLEKNLTRYYVIAGEWEQHMDILLISEESKAGDSARADLDGKLRKIEKQTGKRIPQVDAGDLKPEISNGSYEYRIYENLFPTKRTPELVLMRAAEEFLTESVALPMFFYTSEEIKNNYGRLTGVEVPEEFYIGLEERKLRLLVYRGCEQTGEGKYVHKMEMKTADGKYWIWEKTIYFDESMDVFMVE